MKEYIRKVFEEKDMKIKNDAVDLVNERIEKYIYDLTVEAMHCARVANLTGPLAKDIDVILKLRELTKINKN